MEIVVQSLNCCVHPSWFTSLFPKCEPPDCCCGCCSALRPRYKRLVDNIYPPVPQDGLVRNNMEKLTFYALSSPEKLDRIGEYLALKVSRDISRHRHGFVVIAMEAMDQLLVACHAQSLNLFVESFLKMVQKLLECQEADMQLLATQSFVKFANIEEDTPSYHRRYDFFVSKFSSLCHNCHDDLETRKRLRVAGLKGIQGVVRKTVSDDLQVNIWDETHMDKIIPSLLFNMQGHCGSLSETPDSPQEEANPWALAENCIRELMGRATFGNVRSVIRPVLKHLDNHELWAPNEFAIHTFKIIMYSIQAQYSYSVIQILMTHLDEKSRIGEADKKKKKPGDAKVRTGIVNVLANIVSIAAGESIGPSVLEIFNSLLNHLRHSIDVRTTTETDKIDEKHFQESVINTLGEFANNLPDFQKIEIMMFIMNKVPLPMDESHEADVLLQKILLKSLLKVGTKYRTVQMSQAFPSAFLQPLLQMSLAPDTAVRLVVQHILHTLLDRHDNLKHLSKLYVSGPLPNLKVEEKVSRQDVMFFKKNGPDILIHMYDNVQQMNNTSENFEAIYTTLALICIEFGVESDAMIEMLRLVFAIQDLPVKGVLSPGQYAAMHILNAAFLYLLSRLTGIETFCEHVDKVIAARSERAPNLLPDDNMTFGQLSTTYNNAQEELLFDKAIIAEALRNSGHDISRLLSPYIPRRPTAGIVTVTRSISDLNSISMEVDSINSSPGVPRRHPEEEITVESLKKMMAEPPDVQRQADDERRLRVIEELRTAPFEDLVAKAEHQTVDLQNKLNEIFGKVPAAVDITSRPNSPHPNSREEGANHRQTPLAPPVYNIRFPDHFVY